MTRAVRARILKDVDGNVSDHLRNHIHLTNCIHLKNHMHKHSPILADRALMRDLSVLQRSKSLRDPSASPPFSQSPIANVLYRRVERDALVVGARRPIFVEGQQDPGRMSGSSPPFKSLAISKPVIGQAGRNCEGESDASDHGMRDGIQEQRRVKDKSGGKLHVNGVMCWHGDHPQLGDGLVSDDASENSENVQKEIGSRQDRPPLNQLSDEFDEAVSSQNIDNVRQNRKKVAQKVDASIHNKNNGLNKTRGCRVRGARRNRLSTTIQEAEKQTELPVASNSFAQNNTHQKYVEERVHEYDGHNVNGVTKNGCGIPWNWSSIHHRGKSFLDVAGRSLSCGLSDTRLKKGDSISQERNIPDVPVMSEYSSSSSNWNGEALPLLLEASGSQGSIEHDAWQNDYSGELGIFANNLIKREIDSDLAPENKFPEQHKFWRNPNDKHQNLTQKYMPGKFRDLVGQHLVVQALSNAIVKRKVGLLYAFYGSHGTGKTSCARIFARALNCQSLDHPKPCGSCKSCIAHDMGENQNVREIGPVSDTDFEAIIELFDYMISSQPQSRYRVFIFDDCDSMSSDCWSAILKCIDRAPRHVVFILVCSSMDVMPHIIISRCQKFFFPKLKDSDIIYTLQWIATKEGVEIDKDALKLIASRSDGSLRDSMMTLEQLSLLGQKISLCLVQELVGLISDEKLIDLLDMALSADTVNTVKSLRDIMESGVDPLVLMSQLATVITDILAGSHDFLKEGSKRKFFYRKALTKKDMEKLRQALKILSDTEKQLRVSNDRLTWLTAALLQLAPDQQYMLPSSSADTSFHHSPLVVSTTTTLPERTRKSNAEIRTTQVGSSADAYNNAKFNGNTVLETEHNGDGVVSNQVYVASHEQDRTHGLQLKGHARHEMENIWLGVLEMIPINSVKEFMYLYGKLISISYGAAPTVQLLFKSQLTKSKAEKYNSYILQAFEAVLRSPVTIEIRCDSRNSSGAGQKAPSAYQERSRPSMNPIFLTTNGTMTNENDIRRLHDKDISSPGLGRSEIVEIEAPSREYKSTAGKDVEGCIRCQNNGSALAQVTSPNACKNTSFLNERRMGDRNQSLSLVRGKVSLAQVIQRKEVCSQLNGWSKRKAVSISDKLEQENMRLEPRSRRLLCWNPPRVSRRKLSRLRVRTRKPLTLLKFISCGRCLSVRSPR